ncbi:MAG: DUF6428 family protein [Acidobacteriota bacterium]|nr:DUF6428 family protein [Acidobacteriota bacterium]
MKFQELKAILESHPASSPQFILPDGDHVPAHFHLTEVGYVAKHFIDCGGTTRKTESCVLQLWVSDNDTDHRLDAGKFASILELGQQVLPNEDLDVEVEYDGCPISQFPIASCRVSARGLEFRLTAKHTDCLAKEKCGIGEESCGCGLPQTETARACC